MARARGEARELIEAGHVTVDGRPARKASTAVGDEAAVTVRNAGARWVGRAAYKLAHAFDVWGERGLTAREADCLDVGASTGGFTQVLLAQGAARVTALDVGHGQLAADVAQDVRVVERSGTSIRDVGAADIGTFDVVVGDLSFISLTLVLPTLAELARHGAHVVLLVKPQFEVGRARLSKNGVVTDPRHRRDALTAVVAAADDAGFGVHGLTRSPIAGGEGNLEYLLWARSGVSGTMDQDALRSAIGDLARTDVAPGGRP